MKKQTASPESAEFKSLTVFSNYFSHVDRYCIVLAEYIAESEAWWESKKGNFRTITEDELNKSAISASLQIAIRTSYSVPFKKSRSRYTHDTIQSIPPELVLLESAVEIQLHNRILSDRDQGVAHADSNLTEPEVAVLDSGYISTHEDILPLSTKDLNILRGMLHRYNMEIAKRLEELRMVMPKGEY